MTSAQDEAGGKGYSLRKTGTRPLHPLPEYAGHYEHPGYGTVRIEQAGENLKLRYGFLDTALNHFHYDSFEFVSDAVTQDKLSLRFETGGDGEIASRSVPMLPDGAQLDGAGCFCTHYPVFDNAIRLEASNQNRGNEHTAYIAQGSLMAEVFRQRAHERLKNHRRTRPPGAAELEHRVAQSRASITISGDNIEVTRNLARTMFPGDPEPVIVQEDFAPGVHSRMHAR